MGHYIAQARRLILLLNSIKLVVYKFIHYSFLFSPIFSFAFPHPKAGCPMHWSRSLPYPWIDWNFSTLLADTFTVKLTNFTLCYTMCHTTHCSINYVLNRSSNIDETRWGGGGGGAITWFLFFSLASHFKTHSAFPIRGCSRAVGYSMSEHWTNILTSKNLKKN